jgi:hypothetical protein
MSDDDLEKTVISSRGKPVDEVDDATVVVRRSPVDDETVISSREPVDDETVIMSRTTDIDDTVMSSRTADIDETVISSKTPDVDETVISSREPVDDATVISRRGVAPAKETGLAQRAKKSPSSSPSSAMFRAPAASPARKAPSLDDTEIGSRNDDIDATVVSQRNTADVDETVISSRESQPDVDETVMSSRNSADVDETVMSSRNAPDVDQTVMSSRNADAQAPLEDETVIAGGGERRAPREPDARVGDAQEFVRLGEPVVEHVERVDYGTPPPRIQAATDPAFLYASAMKQRQKRARRLIVLLVGSAVALGVILAVAIVLLAQS